ncbi:MAG: MFS transporter [Campylobacterota bacterium]|nr:MFS transporter [Campylobacterota bacterium]
MFKKVMPLSAILSLRFLGLFLVLPVISAYAASMTDNLILVGIVVGGYALTQAAFQLPFGILSDKIGRKVTIFIGLIIFLIGSIICAISDDIYMLMLGRFLQGTGAIGSVITAMISDLVHEEVRAKAMAMMGGSIALSFALAMGLGPVLSASYGTEILFWITAVLSVMAMVILFSKVPTPPRIRHIYKHQTTTKEILKDSDLLRLTITGALQKGLMSIAFLIIPIVMLGSVEDGGFAWDKSELWKVYVPAMVVGLLAMGPAAVFGEKKNKPKLMFLIAIFFFALSFFLMGLATTASTFIVGVISFFIGFNMLEPLLQSMITKFAKVHQKGAALGISNTFAYLGTFIGGTLAGLSLEIFNREILGIALGVVSLAWLAWTFGMRDPIKYSHLFIPLSEIDESKLENLDSDGVSQYYINETEKLAVFKYDAQLISEDDLKIKVGN